MNVWNFIKSKLKADLEVVLLIVIDSHGSSPGRKGFKMAVSDDNTMFGSVGGGAMEYKLVELVKKQFTEPSGIFSKIENHNSKEESDNSGMICSGSQQVAFYPINKWQLSLIESISDAKTGELIFTESELKFNSEVDSSHEFISKNNDENSWFYKEGLGFKNHLYIFGAGHVSVSVSRIFKQLGFYVTVFDNRDRKLTTFKNNNLAHSKRIINYDKAPECITEGENTYVVIMTFNHADDEKVLKLLIDKNIRYLGMMGSTEKVKSVFNRLKSNGITSQQLKKVDAPIGVQINSHTPDEIAVSIGAMIIRVKNEN